MACHYQDFDLAKWKSIEGRKQFVLYNRPMCGSFKLYVNGTIVEEYLIYYDDFASFCDKLRDAGIERGYTDAQIAQCAKTLKRAHDAYIDAWEHRIY